MFLLGKIIRGYEAEPHSRPYMAFLQIQTSGNIILWGGFLAREDFVLTAATLGQGDSGGPLVCDNVAQGIVSYGQNDGSTPRACTKVSSFLPWIKKTMKSLQLQEPGHLPWS
ncbi:Granzyme B [Camelus dromedarius]|nr:Granzyme B [Camelus dromedarius]